MSNYKLRPYNEEDKEKALKLYAERITYSPRYSSEGDPYEYRHVHLPKPMIRFTPSGLLDENTWRGLGVRQSLGWECYMRHNPEPHILLFRRLIVNVQPLGLNSSHLNGQQALEELQAKLQAVHAAQKSQKSG